MDPRNYNIGVCNAAPADIKLTTSLEGLTDNASEGAELACRVAMRLEELLLRLTGSTVDHKSNTVPPAGDGVLGVLNASITRNGAWLEIVSNTLFAIEKHI